MLFSSINSYFISFHAIIYDLIGVFTFLLFIIIFAYFFSYLNSLIDITKNFIKADINILDSKL